MNKAKVALVRCDTYEEGKVLEAVRTGLDMIGGISMFTGPAEKIVMKPNVLIGSNPESCVTTHPSVFKAVGRILKESNTTVYYGDSPAFGKSETNMRKSGLKQAGDELGFLLADFDSGRPVHHKDGVLIKNFTIANGALDADGIVSLPKLKTHGIVRFTGAVKNQFGCIPGLLKGQYHVKLADPYDFSTILIDLNMVLKPRLYIMDGISAMEGNGPRSGKAKKMNVLLFSSDPIALDATACRIIGLDPEFVPTSNPGEKAGLGTYHAENIEVMGEDIASFFDKSFDVVRTPPMRCTSGRLRTFVKNQICERPVIDRSKCSICGTCVKMCPVEPKAVNWHTGDKTRPPSYKYSRCIRCYCCQETCPEGAISIENPFLSRIFSH
jgi:uncharacterized protein (DUF362 family)/Pyruvate/2-oxoacid:ferredoxin oxidoreductase delta subunit